MLEIIEEKNCDKFCPVSIRFFIKPPNINEKTINKVIIKKTG